MFLWQSGNKNKAMWQITLYADVLSEYASNKASKNVWNPLSQGVIGCTVSKIFFQRTLWSVNY